MTGQTTTSDPAINTQTPPTSSGDSATQVNNNQPSGGVAIFKSALAALALIAAVLVVGNGIVYLMDKADFGKSLPIAQSHLETLSYSSIIGISAIVAAIFLAKKLGGTVASILFGIYNPANILKYALSGAGVAAALLLINAITAAMTGTATPTAVAPFQVMNTSTIAWHLSQKKCSSEVCCSQVFAAPASLEQPSSWFSYPPSDSPSSMLSAQFSAQESTLSTSET